MAEIVPSAFAKAVICSIIIIALSGCVEATYWLDPHSPLPHCFSVNSKVRTWRHPRIYYELSGDGVTADAWDGLFHHVHAKGTVVKVEPDNGGAIIIRMNGVCDRYITRYDDSHKEKTLYVSPNNPGSKP